MANTKHSTAREIIIDRLFHKRCGYSLYQILNIVNRELEISGFRPVSLNTIRNDIDNFRYLYKQEIEVERRGNKNYYRYKSSESSLYNNVLTHREIKHLHNALISVKYLDEYQGTMMYGNLSERLCYMLDIDTDEEPVLIYDQIPQRNEIKKFIVLYEYIRKKTPVYITFMSCDGSEKNEEVIHPYYLRKNGDKWNLLGHNSTENTAAEIPLSNIKKLSIADDIDYKPNKEFDLESFYNAINKEIH